MSFTDADLQRFKENLGRHIFTDIIQDEGLRLIARLEAAERLIGLNTNHTEYEKRLKVWRKARGK
jgi:hypothetical protein